MKQLESWYSFLWNSTDGLSSLELGGGNRKKKKKTLLFLSTLSFKYLNCSSISSIFIKVVFRVSSDKMHNPYMLAGNSSDEP